ncbi:hypothetical protein EVAR_27832_1 [Eumeta japonica]|uniref:Uncharacterized protein n=1 Tax=Eumeta variegata TaxID=151549 RepID=A0A4C1VLL1_EUMVA|nr:hypothetical protein EVAR_27832_1 [Eumeta japonica]
MNGDYALRDSRNARDYVINLRRPSSRRGFHRPRRRPALTSSGRLAPSRFLFPALMAVKCAAPLDDLPSPLAVLIASNTKLVQIKDGFAALGSQPKNDSDWRRTLARRIDLTLLRKLRHPPSDNTKINDCVLVLLIFPGGVADS